MWKANLFLLLPSIPLLCNLKENFILTDKGEVKTRRGKNICELKQEVDLTPMAHYLSYIKQIYVLHKWGYEAKL